MTTDRHACGLTSFLPMSCRGRAEAFARRLQSRLQSLGRQPSDDLHDSEESWLTTSQQPFPTSRQPRLSSSSESDIYFDFDCDFGSPESPQEEATEAIHLNRRECGCIVEAAQDLESGCATASATVTATSPGSSASSDNYYDPEPPLADDSAAERDCSHGQWNGHEPACLDCGADTACFPQPDDCTLNGHAEPRSNEAALSGAEPRTTTTTNETRNDTLKTVGSPVGLDGVDNAGLRQYCNRLRKPRVDYTKCNGLHHEASLPRTETHEEKSKANGEVALTHELDAKAHGEVALTHELDANAHEEAAFTYEPHAKGHEEEAPEHELEKEALEMEASTHDPDTETGESEAETVESEATPHESEPKENEADPNKSEAETEAEAVTQNERNQGEDADSESLESPLSPTDPVHRMAVKTQPTEECCDDNFLSSLNILKQEMLIECPTPATSTVPDVEVTESSPAQAESASPTPKRREDASSRLAVEDDDADVDADDRPQRVRRCSSLKTGKTPPGTPGRKKIVRFADVLGLDLADVRTFLDEVPRIPTSAYSDLQGADLSLGASTSGSTSLLPPIPRPDKLLVPLFMQPGGNMDFLDRVHGQQVCLENAVVSDPMLYTITGTVRVRNLDFNKTVHIRYTMDEWRTFSDLQATYVQNSCDGFSDTFSFTLHAHTLEIGQRLEFAVRFQAHGFQYWDSNRGQNYVFQCLPPAGQSPFRSQPMSTCPDEPWASFY